jgi:hypothetical protein
MLDEAAVTGEPMPVSRQAGELAHSGSVNAGETIELHASTIANESTYAGIVRMVSAAQAAKAPFVRMADRYALLLLPATLLTAGAAWLFSQDPIRALAVLVASTPCPLILAAPVAFIAGVAQAAKRGILIKGSGPLEALARTHTVMFDKLERWRSVAPDWLLSKPRLARAPTRFCASRGRLSRPRITWSPRHWSKRRSPKGSSFRFRRKCTRPWGQA